MLGLLAVTFLVLVSVLVRPAAAASIVVNSAADVVANDGVCTLREAITAANTNAASGVAAGECAAGSGPDTITFANDYTITLVDSQLPTITSVMTITGNGAANTIVQSSTCNPVTLPGGCATANYRVFEVASTGNLTLDGLRVRHGRCSGACSTHNNLGGGILNLGTLTVADSTLSGNRASQGGGIYNLATLTLIGSTFSVNSASAYGGGIDDSGSANVTNSTFSGNSVGSVGGGIYANNSTLALTNSTLSSNTTGSSGGGGGIYANSSIITLNNTTASANLIGNFGNDGGIYAVDTPHP